MLFRYSEPPRILRGASRQVNHNAQIILHVPRDQETIAHEFFRLMTDCVDPLGLIEQSFDIEGLSGR